jgi:hypothetical protein
MVCLMGVFMIAEFSRAFWAPAVMDTIIVLWSVIYFASLRNHAKTASP